MIRLGILSFAHLHAEGYMTALRSLPNVELIGIADDNAQRGRHFAEQFGARWFDSYEALLAEKPDGVVICSENSRHLPLARLAAEAGAHILCEKPLATTPEDALQIVEICERASVHLMTAFPMRFSAPVLEVKKLLDAGSLGAVYGCNSTNQGALPQFHQHEDLPFLGREWFVSKALAGGGAVTDHVVHIADLLRWFFGCEVTEVYAETSRVLHDDKVDVETAGLVMLTFEDGAFASIDCSWSKPAYYPTWGGLKLELVGEKGLVTVDAFKQFATVYSDRVGRPQWAYWGSDANQGMLAEFVAALEQGRAPAISGWDGYKAVEIVAAAYQSVASGQPVAL